MKTSSTGRIYFDIETTALPDNELLLEIHEETPEETAKTLEKVKERAAVSALTGRVLAIGWARNDGPVQIIHGYDEERVLTEFWTLWVNEWADCEKVGFNSNMFDLKFLQQRSWHYQINVPWSTIYTGPDRKWFDKKIVDLMLQWRCGDYKDKFISLGRVSRHLQLPKGKDGLSGALFGYLYEHARKEALAYLTQDVVLLQQAAQIML